MKRLTGLGAEYIQTDVTTSAPGPGGQAVFIGLTRPTVPPGWAAQMVPGQGWYLAPTALVTPTKPVYAGTVTPISTQIIDPKLAAATNVAIAAALARIATQKTTGKDEYGDLLPPPKDIIITQKPPATPAPSPAPSSLVAKLRDLELQQVANAGETDLVLDGQIYDLRKQISVLKVAPPSRVEPRYPVVKIESGAPYVQVRQFDEVPMREVRAVPSVTARVSVSEPDMIRIPARMEVVTATSEDIQEAKRKADLAQVQLELAAAMVADGTRQLNQKERDGYWELVKQSDQKYQLQKILDRKGRPTRIAPASPSTASAIDRALSDISFPTIASAGISVAPPKPPATALTVSQKNKIDLRLTDYDKLTNAQLEKRIKPLSEEYWAIEIIRGSALGWAASKSLSPKEAQGINQLKALSPRMQLEILAIKSEYGERAAAYAGKSVVSKPFKKVWASVASVPETTRAGMQAGYSAVYDSLKSLSWEVGGYARGAAATGIQKAAGMAEKMLVYKIPSNPGITSLHNTSLVSMGDVNMSRAQEDAFREMNKTINSAAWTLLKIKIGASRVEVSPAISGWIRRMGLTEEYGKDIERRYGSRIKSGIMGNWDSHLTAGERFLRGEEGLRAINDLIKEVSQHASSGLIRSL